MTPASSRASSPFRIRCRTAASWGSAASTSSAKTIDFSPIGPAEGVSFAMAPDRKRGYGLLQQIGRYEFWAFDLETKKLLNRTPFEGRPRMALRVSSNGKLLYVFQAGATVDVYEAATYKYLRTVQMDADQTTNLFILPKPTRNTTAQ